MREVFLWLWSLGKPSSPLPVLWLGAATMFSVQLHREIHDVDIFWQVKLGEITIRSGLPANEPFLAGRENEPLAVVAWLGQAAYATVRLLGGWPLLRLFDAAIWFGGFIIVARVCARQAGNDWPALAGLFVGWIAAIPHASLRPQSWALLCFGLLITLVRIDYPSKWKLLLGTLLFVVWQNLHPSVVIGIGYLAATLIATFLPRAGVLTDRACGRHGRSMIMVLLSVALLATILTPAGTDVFAISKYNEEISKERGITEWLPMWWSPKDYGRENAWIAFALTAKLLVFVLVAKAVTGCWRVRALDLLALLGLTAISLLMHRFVIFWGVAVIPVIAEALAFPSSNSRVNRWRLPLVVLVSCTAILPPMIAFPAPFADYYPFKATRELEKSGIRGTIYCNYFWGGVLADSGHPRWKMSHDGRYYLFTREQWKLYNETSQGSVPLIEILSLWEPQAFFLRKNRGHDWPNDEGLIRLLRPVWRVLFEDEQSIIFVPPIG